MDAGILPARISSVPGLVRVQFLVYMALYMIVRLQEGCEIEKWLFLVRLWPLDFG